MLFLEGKFFSNNLLMNNDCYNLNNLNKRIYELDFFFGTSFMQKFDSFDLFSGFIYMCKCLHLPVQSLHFISATMGRLSLLEIGGFHKNQLMLTNYKSVKPALIFLCGVDLAFFSICNIQKDSFIVFQGSFSNNIELFFVNLIFPVKLYIESLASYII